MNDRIMHIKLCRVFGHQEIRNLLEEFNYIFPHLEERKNNFEDYAKKLNIHGKVYCAKYYNASIGIVALYDNNKETREAFISLIGIKPEYQHKGFGTDLILEVFKILKASGMKLVKLEVDNNNLQAIKYYRHNGFDFFCVASENSIYMKRKI